MITLLVAFALAAGQQDAHPNVDISDLAWLAGCWHGTGFGNRVEECWMLAPDGRLTGMFQIIDQDGHQTLSEIFVLDRFEDEPALRLKHFHPDLTGWETRDDFVEFKLLETREGYARFEALEYTRSEAGGLIVDVVVSRNGEERVERLELQRTR